MAYPNLQNGMIPQMENKQAPLSQSALKYQYNGMSLSSQSSRDSSPSTRVGGIPPSQLPPGFAQQPKISALAQKVDQLNINNPSNFNTSTPNQSMNPPVVSSGFSPILPPTRSPNETLQANNSTNFNNSNNQNQRINPSPLTSASNFPVAQIQKPQTSLPVLPVSSQSFVNRIQPAGGGAGAGSNSSIPQNRQFNQNISYQQNNTNTNTAAAVAPLSSQQNRPQDKINFPQSNQFTSASTAPPTLATSVPQPKLPLSAGQHVPHLLQPTPKNNSINQVPQIAPVPSVQKPNLHSYRYPAANQFASQPQPQPQPQPQQYPIQNQQVFSQNTANRVTYPGSNQQTSYQRIPQAQVAGPGPGQYPGQQFKQNAYSQQANYSNLNYHNVVSSGFNKLWGIETVDLLQNSNILPPTKVPAPKVSLGQEALDQANCSPDIFRCTMTKIPDSSSLLQRTRLPLGILIHPFRDLAHLPVIQCNVIVRCRACRTYINPYVYFVDNKRWKCNLCYRVNELPEEFQYDPVSKTYGDPSRRPEVKASTIEYIAPAEYMLRPPQPAIYLFLLDVSRVAVESGYLHLYCQVLLSELQNLPGDARTQVGFLAYDSHLHYFSLAEGLSRPHEMVIFDVDEVFLPCPDNLLVNLKDRMELITDFLNHLPTKYLNSFDNNSALGAALQAAYKMLTVTGGRVTVFQAALPNVGPGALKSREDPNQRASNVETALLNPVNDFYKRLALDCSAQQIAVDLFTVNSQYIDIATISGISRFSGGCMYHFPLFKASRVLQNEAFERSLRRYLTRKIGFEAVMRIRCTRGLSIHTFHGNFFVRSTDLLSLPNTNPDAGFGMQVAIEESLSDLQTVCFQAALLYTSSKGERRIRVHTLCLPVVSTLHDVLNSADQQCIVGLLAKMAVDRSMQSSLADAREAFINVAIDILSSYKLTLNMGEGQSGLLAPECLKLLPLYISALLKFPAFRTGVSIRLDDRVKMMIDMKTKPLCFLIQQVYPDLYPVHNLEEQQVIINSEDEQIPLPPRIQLTARCLEQKGAFLMDMGEHMVMYVCGGVSKVFLNEALGVADFNGITEEMYEIPTLENQHNKRLLSFISHLNEDKPFPATLQVIRENSANRLVFLERLIEDRVENALSYHEFLQHLKSQVK